MNTESVCSWMIEKVITITPQTTLPTIQKIMLEQKIHWLPLVKSDKFVGVALFSAGAFVNVWLNQKLRNWMKKVWIVLFVKCFTNLDSFHDSVVVLEPG